MNRPSETVSAAVASIVGAIFAILIGYGVKVPDAVQPAVIVLTGWVAAGVTWYIARKQAAGSLTSGPTGKVG